MDTFQSWQYISKICKLALVCLLVGLMVVSTARADVGVQPLLPGGSNIKPEDETPIQMVAEVVTMNMRPATEADNSVVQLNPKAYGYQFQSVWFPIVAEVQADFRMNNPSSEAVSMTAWFPLASVLKTHGWDEISPEESVPRIEGFFVAVNGNPVDYEISELPNPNGEDKPFLPWASFPVTFPTGIETNIHVSYVLPLHRTGNALALYYIFQTGAGWAGPIGQAELILNLPYPASTETLAGMPAGSLNPPYFIYSGGEVASIPPGVILEGNQARWIWKDLEPDPEDDFSILLMDLGNWDELQTARAAVKATPDDGQTWMQLCTIYHELSSRSEWQIPMSWSETYRPLGVQACQEAARLLPGDAAPHYVLAVLYLSAFAQKPSQETLQPVQDELRLGQELEAVKPPSEVFLYNQELYSSISEYITSMVNRFSNGAMGTEEQATVIGENATMSLLQPSASIMPTQVPMQPSTVSSVALQPAQTETILATITSDKTAQGSGAGIGLGIVAVGIILMAVVIYLVLKRRI